MGNRAAIMGHAGGVCPLFDVDFRRKTPILSLDDFPRQLILAGRSRCVDQDSLERSSLSRGGAAVAGAGEGSPGKRRSSWRTAASDPAPDRALLDRYCVTCHNARLKTAGLTLDDIDTDCTSARHAETWEKVLRKLRAGQMPPVGRPRPEPAAAARVHERARDRARARRRRRAESRTADGAPPEPDRIRQQHPRPAGARHRRPQRCCRPTTPTRTASTTTPTC